jgi:dTDP-4-dehydrorhamnose 3,5-epimerase
MIFTPTALGGAYLIDAEPFTDERGFFVRIWCEREFTERGLNPRLAQCSLSFNVKRGTLRGMHYQVAPYEEAKLVRCSRGAIFDVIIDLRPNSPTFRQWLSVSLTAENRRMLYLPEGFAHGFETLEDNTEVAYYISEFYAPDCARGIKWNDPMFGIEWPIEPSVVSPRDRDYPDFQYVDSGLTEGAARVPPPRDQA